jgi:hypothetical protein
MNFYYSYYLYGTKVVLIAKIIYLIDFFCTIDLYCFLYCFCLDLNESKHNIFYAIAVMKPNNFFFDSNYILVSILKLNNQ